MTKDAIRYTIRDLPVECVTFLKAQRAHTGRNIGLLVSDALAHWASHDGRQGLPEASYNAAQRPSEGVGELDPSSVARRDIDGCLRSGTKDKT